MIAILGTPLNALDDDRAFSSLQLIDEEAFQQGVAQLERALAREPIPVSSINTCIRGALPRL